MHQQGGILASKLYGVSLSSVETRTHYIAGDLPYARIRNTVLFVEHIVTTTDLVGSSIPIVVVLALIRCYSLILSF